ncbi:response regulator [Leucothrix arctica]|nr:response regulator [Leucothrix arctica]
MLKESLSVLIIEENKGYAESTSLYVKEVLPFAKVAVVGSFCDFLNYLDNHSPDLILSEYKFAGFCGLDVMDYSRQSLPKSLFIFVTNAFEDESIASQTVLAKADDFLLKNTLEKLPEKINKLLIGGRVSCNDTYFDLSRVEKFVSEMNRDNMTHIQSYMQIKEDIQSARF